MHTHIYTLTYDTHTYAYICIYKHLRMLYTVRFLYKFSVLTKTLRKSLIQYVLGKVLIVVWPLTVSSCIVRVLQS